MLSGLPLHILAVINVPKETLDWINSILANFLWGEVEGRRKLHWRSWSKICKLTNEGGLGLRDLHEVQKSLHMKFAYRLLTTEGLWADFFKSKYLRDGHPLSYIPKATNLRMWRSIMKRVPEVMENVQILLRNGNSFFWFDRWLALGPLSARLTDISNKQIRIRDCGMD